MAEVTKLLYILVLDDDETAKATGKEMFRYTRPVLQSTLQLMGCKARHAFKISQRVFEVMKSNSSVKACDSVGVGMSYLDVSNGHNEKEKDYVLSCSSDEVVGDQPSVIERDGECMTKPFELYKRRTTVVVKRKFFLNVVCDALSEYKYVGHSQREDLTLACRIRERKESFTVLLCGTSGCGKSTLSSLLGSRLGITTVISTDSIRHMMRSFADEKQNPLLWASTYHAGDYLDPKAVAEAKAKRKAKKLAVVSQNLHKDNESDKSIVEKSENQPPEASVISPEFIRPKQMAVEGYKAQSEMVIDSLDRLITAWEERKESVVVEGVHLSLNFVMGLMKKHPSIIPFMIYITDEDKHLERFAVRAKYMTLDPAKNKYVKYIRNIRTIQEYLCKRADKHLVPKFNNTNVDKSVNAIHATVFSCLRRREMGEKLYDPATNRVVVVDEEYRNQCAANSLSSKGMFRLIQRQGSSRRLMALMNTDGSVAKAWPFDLMDSNGKPKLGISSENGEGVPMYGPMMIGKAEPVNIQFGHLGICAWPNDTGCTSHASSCDDSKGYLTDNGSRYHSSGCSSPKVCDGPAKELKEDVSVHGSDEEVDDPPEMGSDDDLSDEEKVHEEMEGSVDEYSTKSDEEYDDLAMQDSEGNGYYPDDEELKDKFMPILAHEATYKVPVMGRDKGRQLVKSKSDLSRSCSTPLREKNITRGSPSGKLKLKKRSLSIPVSRKNGSVHEGLIIPGAP